MREFELVIFDCDGVLLDSEIIACRADAKAYTELGFSISTEEVSRRFAGMPDEAVDAILANEVGKPLPDGFRDKIKREVIKKYRTELQAIPGAKDLLTSLSTKKCIASSAAPAKLALGLVETELYELVYPNIFSTSLVENGKPHPDIFLYASQNLNTRPDQCIVVEDSVAGVTAAKSAGMACVGFDGGFHCGYGHRERLIEAGADHVCNTMESIKKILQS